MTTYAPKQDLEAELAEREREAWSRYSGSLRELDGRDYDEAETEAWAELQRHLQLIDAERVA
jgi:rubrerythrin